MAAEVIKLYQDENVEPLQNMIKYASIDTGALTKALISNPGFVEALVTAQDELAKQKEEEKKLVKAKASAKRRTTVGANGTVDPIRDKADVLRIAKYFYGKGQLRNALMFLIGCSIGLRCGDLCKAKVGDISEDGKCRLKEEKTGKYRTVVLNDLAMECYHELVASIPNCTDETNLFLSQKGENKGIKRSSFGRILRNAGKDLNLPYKLGTHSMRKTFGYHLFMDNQQSPEILAYLQRMVNHTSGATTLRYIGLEEEKKNKLYENLDYGFTLDDIKDKDITENEEK